VQDFYFCGLLAVPDEDSRRFNGHSNHRLDSDGAVCFGVHLGVHLSQDAHPHLVVRRTVEVQNIRVGGQPASHEGHQGLHECLDPADRLLRRSAQLAHDLVVQFSLVANVGPVI